jgi:hypothetical protein
MAVHSQLISCAASEVAAASARLAELKSGRRSRERDYQIFLARMVSIDRLRRSGVVSVEVV